MNSILIRLVNITVKSLSIVSNLPGLRHLFRFLAKTFKRKTDKAIRVLGHTMYADSMDRIIALTMWKYSLLESYEVSLIQKITKPRMCVADIGANIGLYALIMAKCVGTSRTGARH